MTPHSILHLHLESGPLILDFQGYQEQVAQVAATLSTIGSAVTVTVDDRVTAEMPKLPCSRLWDEPVHAAADSEPRSETDRNSTVSETRASKFIGPQELPVIHTGVQMIQA